MSITSRNVKFDWLTIFLFASLVGIGWINIYSASLSDTGSNFVDFSQIYFKQLLWIGLSVVLIIFILALDSKFYERFSSVIYLVSLVSLILVFPLGKEISGATSWYSFGGVSIQPSEFAKAATALALAKFISDIQTNIRTFRDQLKAFVIIALPAIIIVPQPDPGSALVYSAFVFAMYREGMHFVYLLLGFFVAALFIGTLWIG
ncbi:MAG: rod shape-determining protein RodA, partial [Bacteroidia bacterium]|nr:rod shape-determining protein RodA [Bacteroidia bacterium]